MLRSWLYIVCFVLGSYGYQLSAQPTVKSFKLQQLQERLQLSFIITEGQYCTGFQIQRSDLPDNFYSIYSYPAVCVDNPEPKNFVVYDEAPLKNITAYYRVYIPPNTYSTIESIRFLDSPADGYILYSNPIRHELKLSVNSANAIVTIYNTSGHKIAVYQTNNEGITQENIDAFSNGIYFFLIVTQEGKVIKGKFAKTF